MVKSVQFPGFETVNYLTVQKPSLQGTYRYTNIQEGGGGGHPTTSKQDVEKMHLRHIHVCMRMRMKPVVHDRA